MEFVDTSTVTLIDSMGDDLDIAKAAWVSNLGADLPDGISEWAYKTPFMGERYDKSHERVDKLINFLYPERHMSPFEHTTLKFLVDCPIFVAREFMRHRTFSYNEVSGRYKMLEPRFYLINSDRPVVQQGKVGAYTFGEGDDAQYGTTFAATTIAYQSAWAAYQKMIDAGVAKEVARNVLPVGIMTQFYVTGNLRNWFQFLTLRDDKNALHEIRVVAKEIDKHVATKFPHAHKAFKTYDWRSEKEELADLRKKVAQYEAEETYAGNIGLSLGSDNRSKEQTRLISKRQAGLTAWNG